MTGSYPRVDPARLVRIYRGVDRTRFHRKFRPTPDWLAEWRAAYPALAGKRLVTLPGRLTRLKGHHDFIDVLQRVRVDHPDVAGLVVGGAAPEHDAYVAGLKERAPHLTFTGHRADVREIMAVSAAVVSLSARPESFGRTVLEALSLGTPVVGYDHGGVGEVLASVYPAGRATPGEPADAAAKLSATLCSATAARRAIRDHYFDLDRMCAQTLGLYEKLDRERS